MVSPDFGVVVFVPSDNLRVGCHTRDFNGSRVLVYLFTLDG